MHPRHTILILLIAALLAGCAAKPGSGVATPEETAPAYGSVKERMEISEPKLIPLEGSTFEETSRVLVVATIKNISNEALYFDYVDFNVKRLYLIRMEHEFEGPDGSTLMGLNEFEQDFGANISNGTGGRSADILLPQETMYCFGIFWWQQVEEYGGEEGKPGCIFLEQSVSILPRARVTRQQPMALPVSLETYADTPEGITTWGSIDLAGIAQTAVIKCGAICLDEEGEIIGVLEGEALRPAKDPAQNFRASANNLGLDGQLPLLKTEQIDEFIPYAYVLQAYIGE